MTAFGAASGETSSDAAIRLILDLEGGCLPVQGPPGAGKTHMAALATLSLIKNRRGPIGVTAVTHNAIRTLLNKIEELAPSVGMTVRMQHRKGDGTSSEMIQIARSNEAVVDAVADEAVDVVGGTSWLFSRPDMEARFDTLIVDEAGQMSLADVLAVSGAARNLVLVGDPRQLAQPLQGSHPPGVGVSALDHLLGGDVTIAPDQGRPARPHLANAPGRHRVHLALLLRGSAGLGAAVRKPGCASSTAKPPPGLRTSFVEHLGDRVRSDAEAESVREIIDQLTQCDMAR